MFAINAAVLALAATALAASPATISFPVALTETIVLVVGLSAMLGLNFALLRRALVPLERLRMLMRGTDPLRPGARASVDDAIPELRAITQSFNEMVERLEEERRESAGRALAAQEGERLRIAQELHDEVGQKLTAAILRLDRAAREPTGPALTQARESVRESLDDVRTIARRLRPDALDALGLVSALTALTNSVQRAGGVRITRRIDAPLPALDPDPELVIYRVAQEALTNVLRHARCREARLELHRTDTGVQLVVIDDGAGFDAAQVSEGAGIRGMRERSLLAGASLEVSSVAGAGTRVTLRVPAPRPAQPSPAASS